MPNELTTVDYDNTLIITERQYIKKLGDLIVYSNWSVLSSAWTHTETGEGTEVGIYGTGSSFELKVTGGVSANYTVIVVGDINGDSICDVLDCAAVGQYAVGKASYSQLQKTAVKGIYSMDDVTASDYQSIVNRMMQTA